MDPLTTLLGAVIAGAAAALQNTVGDAVKDGYAALKHLLAERYREVDLAPVEFDPRAPDSRLALEQQLRQSGAPADVELLARARALLEQVAHREPELACAVGVDLRGIEASTIRIEDVVSAGAGVRVEKAAAAGDFVVSKVRAGDLLGKR